eukprot:TRINITY_DN91258_c0_g1_i1.p1 TRINITY_DN91258_c0_g1~~TRINITY_DN91258_c0_g1_i1.p1  ORF type:complete len:476 (+),score=63.49 TRINITY_DN91258_c0_g1_i1:72-1499(+)
MAGGHDMVPELMYFLSAARGEHSRLLVAAGGLELTETCPGSSFKRQPWQVFGSMPVLLHGGTSIAHSGAIEKYLGWLAPKFSNLTIQQRATDHMYAKMKEDVMQVLADIALGKKLQKEQITTAREALDDILTALEDLTPDTGFINGLDFPTGADLICLEICESRVPIGIATQKIEYDFSKLKKLRAVAIRTREAPGVREYLDSSTSFRRDRLVSGICTFFRQLFGRRLWIECGCCKSRRHKSALAEPVSSAAANLVSSVPDSEVIQMSYFPHAGRGELSRLIAAAGGLDQFRDGFPGPDYGCYGTKLGFRSEQPTLKHGDFRMFQSMAIESYLAMLSPKFKNLTPLQRAVDEMFACTHEDLIEGCAKYVVGDPRGAGDAIPKHLDKFLIPLEKRVPSSGFINGLSYPTVADLVLLSFSEAIMPFGIALELTGGTYEWHSKFPNIKANVERTKSAPGVKEYLEQTSTMSSQYHGWI